MGRSGVDLAHLHGRRILIHASGSHIIGLGHIFRMRALASALEHTGSLVAFLTQADPTANGLLESSGFKCYIFETDSFESVRLDALLTHRPDVIIQDILATSSKDMAELRSLTSSKIINIDDIGAGLQIADVVINSMVFHWGKYIPDECHARLFEGPQYMMLDLEVGNYTCLEKDIAGQARRILVAFGGTDTHYVTERALQAINLVRNPLELTINIGPGRKGTPVLEQAVRASPHQVQVLQAPPNLFEELYQADIVVCAGGIMLYELAAIGVPCISIPTEPHEIYNTAYWAGIGTAIALDWEKHLNPAQITQAVTDLLPDQKRRAEMSAIGKHIMDTSGLDRVMKIVDEVLS